MQSPPRATFADAAFLGAISSGVSLALTVLRSKVAALVLGPIGLGMAAEVTQYVFLMTTPAAVVSGTALSSGLAEAQGRKDTSSSRRIYSTALTALFLLALVGGTLSIFVCGLVLGPELGHGVWLFALLAAVGMFGSNLASIPCLVLTAHGDVRTPVRISLYAGVLLAVVSVLCIVRWGLPGLFVALALTPVIALAVTLPLASRALPDFPWRPTWTLDWRYLRFALGVGVATFAGAMLQQVVLMLVRRLLDRQGGSALIGQFQAAWAVGATYFGVVLGGLASFAFPRYAAATTPEALSREVDEAARLVLRAAPPIVFMAIALADLVIELLYSGQFAPATRLLAWQFVGDLPKALAWVLGGPLLYRGRVRATLVAEFFFSVVFVAGALLCVPLWGLEGVGFAYAAAYVAFLLLVRWLLQRECGVRREPSQLWWVLGL
ncbi:MAG: polysaccharide biosynthesis C-terminal domain-containing protein, partial [Myxococcaceae bacterium]|nr:polysaccharide biosynthesis C-terminal domain-containing protein [Myxococcaceae bacterium]